MSLALVISGLIVAAAGGFACGYVAGYLIFPPEG